jgi:hypothetical protein
VLYCCHACCAEKTVALTYFTTAPSCVLHRPPHCTWHGRGLKGCLATVQSCLANPRPAKLLHGEASKYIAGGRAGSSRPTAGQSAAAATGSLWDLLKAITAVTATAESPVRSPDTPASSYSCMCCCTADPSTQNGGKVVITSEYCSHWGVMKPPLLTGSSRPRGSKPKSLHNKTAQPRVNHRSYKPAGRPRSEPVCWCQILSVSQTDSLQIQ